MKDLEPRSEPLSCPMGFLVVISFEMKNDYRELSVMRCRLEDEFWLGLIAAGSNRSHKKIHGKKNAPEPE